MLANFTQQSIKLEDDIQINTLVGGKGEPILLLHGYPQTHLMWHKIAPTLAEDFTVILTDLRGYGDSSKPLPDLDNNLVYAKRTMAEDQVKVMSYLGYDKFYLAGHDRGARVAHRLTLDYPEKVKKLAVLDIIPTYDLYKTTDQEFATAYYHWFFLIQPFPFPETLINYDPVYFLHHCLKSWSNNNQAFSPQVIREYERCFSQPETVRATCEDYRAAATIDLEHDCGDRQIKITCPVLALWGKQGIIGKKYDVIKIWQERAINVTGFGLDCGHFMPEESAFSTYQYLNKFFSG